MLAQFLLKVQTVGNHHPNLLIAIRVKIKYSQLFFYTFSYHRLEIKCCLFVGLIMANGHGNMSLYKATEAKVRRLQTASTAQYQLQRGTNGNTILLQKTSTTGLTNSYGNRNPQPDTNGKHMK